jgi:UDP-N-acetyl-2-amino-2-deoxyglucuronate dehydrogenase
MEERERMSQSPMRVASVGLGQWARVIAAAAARSDKLEIVKCFSRSYEKREAFAQEFCCDQAASYAELLADDRVEAVLLTTPSSANAEAVEQAAAAGKHVWLEKPISHKIEEAFRIREALKKTEVTFAVGHGARVLGASRKMKALIDNEDIGRLSLIEAHWSTGRALSITPDEWRWYADATPGGPLIQLLVHHFDTVQFLLGPIAEVQAYKRRLNTLAEVDDVAVVITQFDSGNLGYFGTSWVSPGIYWIHIYGTEANLYQELNLSHWNKPDVDEHTTLFRQARDTNEKLALEFSMKDMFRDELEEFVDAVRNGRDPEVGWEQATRALACVEAAIRSANSKRPVTIAEVMADRDGTYN